MFRTTRGAPRSQVEELYPDRDKRHIYLAWSLGRTVSFASGLFALGPRGGRKHRYAVRLGIDECGIAKGGCCLTESREQAEEWFLKYAAEEELQPATFGGTPTDPDSIDVELVR